METKFTKVEWIITTHTSKTDPQRIATTAIQENPNKVSYICDMWGMATDEGKANAKLIAAAPDLLEAIIELYDSLPDGYTSKCLPKVRTAIKKATE